VAILAAPVGAFLHGSSLAVMQALAAFSTSDRRSGRHRALGGAVAIGTLGIVSVAMAWGVALGIALLVAAASHLPSVEEYSDHSPPPTMLHSARAIMPIAADDAAPAPAPPPAGLAGLPLAALLLAAVRPWRWQRRYTDAAGLPRLPVSRARCGRLGRAGRGLHDAVRGPVGRRWDPSRPLGPAASRRSWSSSRSSWCWWAGPGFREGCGETPG
jgi:hypothetical protein